ncbi:DUF3072 domain-containing protein [Ponticoccus sp. (in: a-proteobacteria)]|uniref:DUF3072 domain-containing protein n=1 Tax=Ponticoccus sp. (in: a-proteobacteria) TaxID=1925025 RepID=UPI003AB5701F
MTQTSLVDGAAEIPADPHAPMTDYQAAVLLQLCEDTGEDYDDALTSRQADRRIDTLRGMTE